MTRLAFSLYGQRAGLIVREGGRIALTYDPEYLSQDTATPLSLSMPLQSDPYPNRLVEAYLRGLLPDSTEVRRRWADAFGLRDRDTLGLIAAIGLDCAGGALFAPEDKLDEALDRDGMVVPLSEKEVGDHLRQLRVDEYAWHENDEEHWSLAGGQSKFTLFSHAKGLWGKPTGSVPSTHIIKPGISRIPAQALTEHVTMRALSMMGESVAHTEYIEFDGEPAIVIERFDRRVAADSVASPSGTTGGSQSVRRVVRIHSEDIVQSFGLDPSKKYEADGGPGAMRIATLLRSYTRDDSLERFVRALIANYLLAAPDAHGKNYSMLLIQNQASLAPLYDVASGLMIDDGKGGLRYRRAAMAIGGKSIFGEVTGHHWKKLSANVGMSPEFVFNAIRKMAEQLPDALNDALTELPKKVSGRELLVGSLMPGVQRMATDTMKSLDSF